MSGGKRRSVAAAATLSSMANGRARAAASRAGERRRDHAIDPGARRRVGAEAPDERVERGRRPGGLHLDPAGGVADAPGEPELGGQAPHERAEADPLDDALDDDAATPGRAVAGGGDARAGADRCTHANRLPPGSSAADGPNGPSMSVAGRVRDPRLWPDAGTGATIDGSTRADRPAVDAGGDPMRLPREHEHRPVTLVWLDADEAIVLRSAVPGGAVNWLRVNQQTVNSLNVFPVPDGDTGTNMVLTMQAAVQEISTSDDNNIGKIAHAVAQGALMGARGNSGVILSQLWRGFARSLDSCETMGPSLFVEALLEAKNTAYKGVVRPVEGTILTVAKDIAAAAETALKENPDLLQLLETIVSVADASVIRTPDLLPVLKQAGVVDAGGKGLFYIYEGMLRYQKGSPLNHHCQIFNRYPPFDWKIRWNQSNPVRTLRSLSIFTLTRCWIWKNIIRICPRWVHPYKLAKAMGCIGCISMFQPKTNIFRLITQ